MVGSDGVGLSDSYRYIPNNGIGIGGNLVIAMNFNKYLVNDRDRR